jgi:hypothetical protein
VAISKAKEAGAKAVVCASTGNTSASAAAYAGRAGLTCAVLIPEGHIALGKLAQALVHQARVLQVRGNFDQALAIVRELESRPGITVVNSINPFRIEGQKTGAFEIVDVLGEAPDFHCIPVGNAGNISAYWRGYLEYKDAGRSGKLPRMLGFQAEGAAPIVLGRPVEDPDREPGLLVRGDGGSRRVGRGHRGGQRRRDPRRVPVPRGGRVGLLRACVGRVGGRAAQGWGSGGVDRCVRAHRARPEGSGPGDQPDRGADPGRGKPRRGARRDRPLRAVHGDLPGRLPAAVCGAAFGRLTS